MSVFWLIIGSLLSLNLLWAWHADATLRRGGHTWKARIWPPFFALGMGGLLVVFILARGMDFPLRSYLPAPLVVALYLWHLIVLPAWFVLSPPAELGRLILIWRRWRRKSGGLPSAPALSPARRRLLGALAAAAPPLVLGGVTAVALPQLSRFRVRELEVRLPALPPAFDGLVIGQVSDTHVGVFTTGPTLDDIARATSGLGADLVMMTGDLINDDLADLPEAIAMVKSIRSRHGVYLCEGNHDLIPGAGHFARECKAAGLNLLVNESQVVSLRGSPLQILGLRWGKGGEKRDRAEDYAEDAITRSMEELLAQRKDGAYPVLLAHHPHAFDAAAAAGVPLTLSGHTHGGQLMVNEDLGFGPALYRYWSGLYQAGASSLVVSNGAGNWFPLRAGAPAEILRLTLRRA